MLSLRLLGTIALAALLNFKLSTCRSPGDSGKGPSGHDSGPVVELSGVDTSALTGREKHDWSSAVSQLYAPCPDHPVSVAQCVKESRACKACVPAAHFLVRQVRMARPRAQIDVAYKKRFAPDQVKEIPLAGSPTKGPDDAPVLIVEWADFQCGACGKAFPVLERLFKRYPNQVKLVFKNYPLSTHKHAEKAARAGMAAGRQGKFWEMHKKLFELQPAAPDETAIERLSREIGLDAKKFAEDLASEAVADEVARDRKQGDAAGLESTPFLFLNGRHYDLDYFDLSEDLDEWIKLEIELKTGKKVVPQASADDDAARVGTLKPDRAERGAPAPPGPSAPAAPSGSTKAKVDPTPKKP